MAKAIGQRWPGLAVRRLPPPRGLSLEVGWTGKPASTTGLVARLTESGWRESTAYREFARLSGQSVRAAAEALEQRDNTALLDQIRLLRKLLEEFDRDTRLGVFTEDLVALCDAAESENGAGKPSGAGGGDCGIALVPAGSAVPRLRERWAEAGLSSLPARVVMDERTLANDS